MKNNKLLSDLALLGFLLLIFIIVVFTTFDQSSFVQNIIFMNVALLLAIITYFTTITAGLILNLIFIFLQGSYALYQSISTSETFGASLYFWLVMTPLLSVTLYMFSYRTQKLQAENSQLERKNRQLGILDDETRLRTIRAYKEDAQVFMSTSRRFNLPVTMVVIQVKHWNELQRMLSEDQISAVIGRVTSTMKQAIRDNDILYVLERENLTWGLLLFTDQAGARVVTERIKEFFEESISDFSAKNQVQIEIKSGAAEYVQETIKSPYDFVEAAIKELEYDV